MDVLRTADDRFSNLAEWSFAPRYVDVGGVRMHYVDEGPGDAPVVLLLHGEPTWSYLYRTIIADLAAAGLRAVAPDMIGFGRSDKPAAVGDHSYERHVGWTRAVVEALDLRDVTLVGQDWGGLIGLRLIGEIGDRFAAVVAANTGLPTGDLGMPDEWWRFRRWVERADDLPIGFLVDAGCVGTLPDAVKAAYDAPFPDDSYKAGPRAMPLLVPTAPDDPATAANRRTWERLTGWDKPFVCAFSDSDPITAPARRLFIDSVPGARGHDHPTITGAGHFLQEDAGDRLADVVVRLAGQVYGET